MIIQILISFSANLIIIEEILLNIRFILDCTFIYLIHVHLLNNVLMVKIYIIWMRDIVC